MAAPNWPPDHHIYDYHGPYPIRDLESARRILIRNMTEGTSSMLEMLKPKLGISSRFGRALIPPLPPFGISSQYPSQYFMSDQTKNGWDTQNNSARGNTSMASGDGEHYQTSGETGDRWGRSQKPVSNFSNSTVRQQPTSNPSATATVTSLSKQTVRAGTILISDESGSSEDDKSKTPAFYSGINQRMESTRQNPKKHSSGGHDKDSPKKLKSTFSTAAGSASESDSESKRSAAVVQTYKCDYCAFLAPDFLRMKKHLAEAIHSSGSLYSAAKKDKTLDLMSVEQMLAVKDPQSKKSTVLVIVCPTCKDIFEDIFVCGLHHKYVHGSTSRFYSICEIEGHKEIQVPTTPYCLSCEMKFSKFKDLHQHWDSHPKHNPYHETVDNPLVDVFLCPYCNKLFKPSRLYFEFENHIVVHSQKQDSEATSVAVPIRHLKISPSGRETLPPFSMEKGHYDGINSELVILTNMYKTMTPKHQFNNTEIPMRLRELKSHLKSKS